MLGQLTMWTPRRTVVVAIAGYLLSTVLLGRAQSGAASLAMLLLVLAPGVVLGAVVPDWRILVVPVVALAAWLPVAYAADPDCDSCGFTSSWIGVMAFAFGLVALAVLTLSLGILLRRAASRWSRARSQSRP